MVAEKNISKLIGFLRCDQDALKESNCRPYFWGIRINTNTQPELFKPLLEEGTSSAPGLLCFAPPARAVLASAPEHVATGKL